MKRTVASLIKHRSNDNGEDMARIFLSYSREDREQARRIVRLLEIAGFEVWWERRIPAGKTWRRVHRRGTARNELYGRPVVTQLRGW
jgi:hypothetical protein